MCCDTGLIENGVVQNENVTQPLLLSAGEKKRGDDDEEEDEDEECDKSEESAEEIQKPVTSVMAAYKLLTPSVKVKKTSFY